MKAKKRKNVLITGASGFVGRTLTKELLKTENNLFLVSRDKKFKCPEAKIFYGDLANEKFCKKIIKDIDLVYYLAGLKKNIAFHTSRSFEFLSGNVSPFISFLKAAQKSRIKMIVYASSTIVEYTDMKESANAAIDGYVWGKYINELILKAFTAETGISAKIVRLAPMYGPGNDFNPKIANIIPSLIIKADQADDKIIVWGKGLRKLQFIYIDDAIDNIMAVSKSPYDFFVIGNTEVVSVNALVSLILKLMDKKLKIVHDVSKPDKFTQLSSFTNIRQPKVTLERGLLKTINYYRRHHA